MKNLVIGSSGLIGARYISLHSKFAKNTTS